jgi:hypothetical protein
MEADSSPTARFDELVMLPPSSLVFLPHRGGWGHHATCDGCRVLSLRSFSPANPGRAKTRPFPRRRWRALFEGPFGQSPGRNKLRSQAARGPCGFTHRRSRGDHPPSMSSFWCARWASKGDEQPQHPPFSASTGTDQADPPHCGVRAREINSPCLLFPLIYNAPVRRYAPPRRRAP